MRIYNHILTEEGPKKIEDLKEHDVLWTLQGPRPLERVSKRFSSRKVVRIKTMGTPQTRITIDTECEVLVRPADKERDGPWKMGFHWTLGQIARALSPRWMKAKDLRPGYYIAIGTYQTIHDGAPPPLESTRGYKRIRQPSMQDANDLAYLAGWFAAEGYCHRYQLIFCLGYHERKKAEEIASIVKRLFGVEARIRKTHNERGLLIMVHSVALVDYFRTYLVGYDKSKGPGRGKYLKEWILTAPPDLQMSFLRGWLEGDGYLRKREKIWQYTGSTTSRTMAWQIYHMALRCGMHPSLRQQFLKSNFKPEGTLIQLIYFPPNDTRRIAEEPAKNSKGRRFWADGFLWTPISDVRILPHYGYLYDIEVDGDTYYTLNGILVKQS